MRPRPRCDERIAPHDGDLVVRKLRVGAFAAPGFEPGLQERGITTLVLTGLSDQRRRALDAARGGGP